MLQARVGVLLAMLAVFSLTLSSAACTDQATTAAKQDGPTATGDGRLLFRDLGRSDAPVDSASPPRDAKLEGAPKPDAALVGALPAQGVTLFVNLGDSLAAGCCVTANHAYRALLAHNDPLAYPAFIGKDLATRYPGIKFNDKSKSGAVTKDVIGQAKAISNNLLGHTLVVISAGGNDSNDNILTMVDPLKADAAAATAVANLSQVVAYFRQPLRFPGGVTIALLTVHDPTDGTGNVPPLGGLTGFCSTLLSPVGVLLGPLAIGNLGRFNAALTGFAQQQGLVLIGNHDAFLGHGYHHAETNSAHYHPQDPTLWFHNDCAHLNDRGHHEVRRLLWQALVGS